MAADFIKKLKTVEKIEVLPYHNMEHTMGKTWSEIHA